MSSKPVQELALACLTGSPDSEQTQKKWFPTGALETHQLSSDPFPPLRLQASYSTSLCFGLSLRTTVRGTIVSSPLCAQSHAWHVFRAWQC